MSEFLARLRQAEASDRSQSDLSFLVGANYGRSDALMKAANQIRSSVYGGGEDGGVNQLLIADWLDEQAGRIGKPRRTLSPQPGTLEP